MERNTINIPEIGSYFEKKLVVIFGRFSLGTSFWEETGEESRKSQSRSQSMAVRGEKALLHKKIKKTRKRPAYAPAYGSCPQKNGPGNEVASLPLLPANREH